MSCYVAGADGMTEVIRRRLQPRLCVRRGESWPQPWSPESGQDLETSTRHRSLVPRHSCLFTLGRRWYSLSLCVFMSAAGQHQPRHSPSKTCQVGLQDSARTRPFDPRYITCVLVTPIRGA